MYRARDRTAIAMNNAHSHDSACGCRRRRDRTVCGLSLWPTRRLDTCDVEGANKPGSAVPACRRPGHGDHRAPCSAEFIGRAGAEIRRRRPGTQSWPATTGIARAGYDLSDTGRRVSPCSPMLSLKAGSPASARCGKRSNNDCRPIRSSIRASAAPRQACTPVPKLM
jgi:hypothetical protein